MEVMEIAVVVMGVMMSIIGFFLKQALSDLKCAKTDVGDMKTKLSVIENDYINKIDKLNGKFDSLYTALEKLSNQLERLNDKITKS